MLRVNEQLIRKRRMLTCLVMIHRNTTNLKKPQSLILNNFICVCIDNQATNFMLCIIVMCHVHILGSTYHLVHSAVHKWNGSLDSSDDYRLLARMNNNSSFNFSNNRSWKKSFFLASVQLSFDISQIIHIWNIIYLIFNSSNETLFGTLQSCKVYLKCYKLSIKWVIENRISQLHKTLTILKRKFFCAQECNNIVQFALTTDRIISILKR